MGSKTPLSAASISKGKKRNINKSERWKTAIAAGRKARWTEYKNKKENAFGVRMPVKELWVGDYGILDCGCIIRFVEPVDESKSANIRPLAVLNNTKCEIRRTTEDVYVCGGDPDLGVYGSYRHGSVGAKKHYIGSVIYDSGARYCVRIRPEDFFNSEEEE